MPDKRAARECARLGVAAFAFCFRPLNILGDKHRLESIRRRRRIDRRLPAPSARDGIVRCVRAQIHTETKCTILSREPPRQKRERRYCDRGGDETKTTHINIHTCTCIPTGSPSYRGGTSRNSKLNHCISNRVSVVSRVRFEKKYSSLTPVAGPTFETKIEIFFLESFFRERNYCPRILFSGSNACSI